MGKGGSRRAYHSWGIPQPSPAQIGEQEVIRVTYVITEPCIDVKDLTCVEVCPVDCIHPTEEEPDFEDHRQLYIDPAECIDCDACVEVCPVDAIFPEDQVPSEWAKFTEINAQHYTQN
jgi:NAD-dependent dihydropyrimidine dehydrogenase PreA subunit